VLVRIRRWIKDMTRIEKRGRIAYTGMDKVERTDGQKENKKHTAAR